ncbi:hypothetical protein TUA1478L_33880 [Lactiplantibacillus plantarum]
MKFLDLFAGIGGFHLGMEQAGHQCVGWIEWDKFARQSYQAIHDVEGIWNASDIRTVRANELPQADCWCFGFPCQDISVAGKQKGFTAGKRSSLFLQLQGLLETSKKRIDPATYSLRTLKTYLVLIEDLTFSNFKLNWMKSGTTVNGMFLTQPKSSLSTGNVSSLSDILEDDVPSKYFLSSKVTDKLLAGQMQQIPLPPDMEKHKVPGRTLLKVNRRK